MDPHSLPGVVLITAWLLGCFISRWAKRQNFSVPPSVASAQYKELKEGREAIQLIVGESDFPKFGLLLSPLIKCVTSFLDPATQFALKTTSRHFYGKPPQILVNPNPVCLPYTRQYVKTGLRRYFHLFNLIKRCGNPNRNQSYLCMLLCIWPEYILSVPVCLVSFMIGGLADMGSATKKVVKKCCPKERLPPVNGFFLWKESSLQEQLVAACERGDLPAVQLATIKGAVITIPDAKGKWPLGAAIWGMSPEVINYLLEQGKDKPDIWKNYEKHNLDHYGEVFIVSQFTPVKYSDWLQLLQKIESSPFIFEKHLQEAKQQNFNSWKTLIDRRRSQYLQWCSCTERIYDRTHLDINRRTDSLYKSYQMRIQEAIEGKESRPRAGSGLKN